MKVQILILIAWIYSDSNLQSHLILEVERWLHICVCGICNCLCFWYLSLFECFSCELCLTACMWRLKNLLSLSGTSLTARRCFVCAWNAAYTTPNVPRPRITLSFVFSSRSYWYYKHTTFSINQLSTRLQITVWLTGNPSSSWSHSWRTSSSSKILLDSSWNLHGRIILSKYITTVRQRVTFVCEH